jgi:uncharacterized protein
VQVARESCPLTNEEAALTISLYQSSVPVFERCLTAFVGVLDKAAAHAAAHKVDPAVYLATRLRPDMLAFARQVQIFCDNAKNASARLAAVEPPKFEDNEASFDELKARINKTLDFLETLKSGEIDGAADREIVFPVGPNKMKMKAGEYLLHFSLPNFYFHLTTAYDLLRFNGVDIGKRDYLGAIPGIAPA